MSSNIELRNERNVDFFEGLKGQGQERHGTTKRYGAESMFGLKEETVTESRRLWYRKSFMNCCDYIRVVKWREKDG
jgi:hypothetical protein